MLLSIGIRLDDPEVVMPVVKLFRQRTEELRNAVVPIEVSNLRKLQTRD
jgi:hypothetical protein